MKRIFHKKPLIISIYVIVFLILAGTPSFYFYQKYQALKQQAVIGANKDEVIELVAKVARHILLPEGEMPTVMSVTDKEKLSGQAFFIHAKNGDKVLVYTEAKKAFLYDPIADKILEVGPVSKNSTESAQQLSPQRTMPLPVSAKFMLLNGTQTVGLTKTYETELKAKIPGAEVLDRDNAKGSYEKSVLVSLTGSSRAGEYASLLGFTLTPLPAGEATSSADFLIILGEDKK